MRSRRRYSGYWKIITLEDDQAEGFLVSGF
jgi:hypothetical protein